MKKKCNSSFEWNYVFNYDFHYAVCFFVCPAFPAALHALRFCMDWCTSQHNFSNLRNNSVPPFELGLFICIFFSQEYILILFSHQNICCWLISKKLTLKESSGQMFLASFLSKNSNKNNEFVWTLWVLQNCHICQNILFTSFAILM